MTRPAFPHLVAADDSSSAARERRAVEVLDAILAEREDTLRRLLQAARKAASELAASKSAKPGSREFARTAEPALERMALTLSSLIARTQ